MSRVAASRLLNSVASHSIRGFRRAAASAPYARFTGPTKSLARAFATSGSPSSTAVPDAEVIEPATTPSETTQSTSSTDTTTASAAPPIDAPPTLHNTQTHSFQTETRQILDIVAHSLYTDKEVFMRELISNASDASEKLRYIQSSGQTIVDADKPLELRITTDEASNTITIQDYGIGMTREELISHLGTIARSGSKQFLQNLKDKAGTSGGALDASNIIGQFGVGFYSTFMVADKVEVFTQAAVGNEPSHHWSSDGTGTYELSDTDRCVRGTKVVIHLKESQKEFSNKQNIETIIKKYSNFVGYPIYLNNTLVNTVGAIWLQRPDTVTEAQHVAFYRYYGNAYDDPLYRLHLSVDAPIAIHALFYFPERHMEKYGMGRLEPGVNLYSRKILIKSKCKEVLPEWLRFIKGVVDSEDIPLNISRENMQDSRLLKRIYHVLTKKILKFLLDESEKNPIKYKEFILEYNNFLKEGAISDPEYKIECARLLRFDSSLETNSASHTDTTTSSTSSSKPGEETALKSSGLVSLDDYISRMPPEQRHIYYLSAPSRAYALASPYYESFAKKHTEVLFLYQPIDDFVMKNVNEYNGRLLKSVESEIDNESKEDEETSKKESKSNLDETKQLIDFMTTTLDDKVSSIKATDRLSSSPAIIVSQESAAFRRMMRFVEQEGGALADTRPLPKQKMEINVKHPLLQSMSAAVRSGDSNQLNVAKMCCLQLFDLALLQADLMDNPRSMVNRISDIMSTAMNGITSSASAAGHTSSPQASTTPDQHANASATEATPTQSTTTSV